MRTKEEIEAEINKNFPFKEQSIMMFAYTAFIELLKYQKEKIAEPLYWDVYITSLKKQMNEDLDNLLTFSEVGIQEELEN